MGERDAFVGCSELAPGIWCARLAGTLNEQFSADSLIALRGNTLVFDLHEVRVVTSVGVREWVNMVRELQIPDYFFYGCQPAMVSQFSMLANFMGSGVVVNFYVPYACSECGNHFEMLFDMRSVRTEVLASRAPAANCPSCGRAGTFDEDARYYFAFVARMRDREVPETLVKLLPSTTLAGPREAAGESEPAAAGGDDDVRTRLESAGRKLAKIAKRLNRDDE